MPNHRNQSRKPNLAVQLAVLLGREDAGRFKSPEQIYRDAESLIRAGAAARRAVTTGRLPDRAYALAADVVSPYGIRLVRRGEIAGVTLGVCFWNAPSVGPEDVFRVA